MNHKIEMLYDDKDDIARDVITFRVKVDGQPVLCEISYEAMMSGVGASISGMLATFQQNRMSIQELVSRLADQGRIENGQLKINSRDFRRG
jgi:hypothetical protein